MERVGKRNVLDVEAYTASWIEILPEVRYQMEHYVEAYTASWIEIYSIIWICHSTCVEAYTASWIEMA